MSRVEQETDTTLPEWWAKLFQPIEGIQDGTMLAARARCNDRSRPRTRP